MLFFKYFYVLFQKYSLRWIKDDIILKNPNNLFFDQNNGIIYTRLIKS